MKHYKLNRREYRVTDGGHIQCRTSSEHDWVTSRFESESDLISNGAVLVEPSKAMHSPTPWREKSNRVFITGDNGTILLTVDSIALRAEEDRANAAHIVKCVNLHEELVDVCRIALEAMSCTCNPSKEAPTPHCDCITCDAANKLTAAIATATT